MNAEETIVARVFAKHGLRLPVDISFGKVGNDHSYPYIEVGSWIKALDQAGKLYRFTGLGTLGTPFREMGGSLEEFWKKFEVLHGSHQVFGLKRDVLRQCVPVYLHGDEGITYKKDGCLCLSIHSPLGRGTLSSKLGPIDCGDVQTEHHVNFIGHAFETCFLLGSLLKVP